MLIVIRRIFKDLSNLELSSNWFDIKMTLHLYDIITKLILFFMIYVFSYLRED